MATYTGGSPVAFCLFGVVSGSFYVVPSFSGSFRFFTNYNFSHNVSTCKFTKNEFHVRFDYKVRQTLLQIGAALMCQKVGQVLLQNRPAFLYWYYQGDIILFIAIQSGVSSITKYDRYSRLSVIRTLRGTENSFEL